MNKFLLYLATAVVYAIAVLGLAYLGLAVYCVYWFFV